ncbi:hypothetical protein ACFQX6_32935 [Streptosporangium lutulentum]
MASTRQEEDGEELLSDAGVMQRTFSNPGVLLFLALTVVTLIAERALLGGARMGGGALVPVASGASDLWDLYTEGYHQTGLGSGGWAPPYVAVLAALSTVLFGKTWLAVSLLLLGCVPLAGFSAYAATRSMISGRWTRVWLASSYALLPVATGTISAGRLGTAVVFVLLPVYAALATVVLTGERRRARRAAWGLGLLLAVGTAFAPLVYPLTAILGALATLAFPRRGVVVSMVIAFGVPAALLFPWLAQMAGNPGRLLLEAGLHQPALVDPRLPAESLLLLSPGGPGMPPLWVTGGLIAACLAALLMRRNRMIIAVGWGVALFGVLVAILVSRTPVTSLNGDAQAPAWPECRWPSPPRACSWWPRSPPTGSSSSARRAGHARSPRWSSCSSRSPRRCSRRACGSPRAWRGRSAGPCARWFPRWPRSARPPRADPAPSRQAGRPDLHRAARPDPTDRRGRHPRARGPPGAGPDRGGRAGVGKGRRRRPGAVGPRRAVRRGGRPGGAGDQPGAGLPARPGPDEPVPHDRDVAADPARRRTPAPPGDPWHGRWLWAQALTVLVVLVLAAPGSRPEADEHAPRTSPSP